MSQEQWMDIDTYQEWTGTTAEYPQDIELAYLAMGLTGEAGEVCNKIKKVYRDNNGVLTSKSIDEIGEELGDVLWYLVRLADVTGHTMDSIIKMNVDKLEDRKARGQIQGVGDHR